MCRGDAGAGAAVRAGLYARVSTERQAERGTIGSQLALLREHIAAAGDELVGEYVDDGHSGARLDRPALDALRDAAEAGLIERVWCLSPDRLARAYAYQVLVLDELARFGVAVAFTDSPGAGRRRSASHPAHPGAGRDRRVREGQDRRTLPARQAVSGPRRGDRHLESPIRLPPHSP
jgi:Resolvase, N terminal domain